MQEAQKENPTEAAPNGNAEAPTTAEAKREISSIQFPYGSLDDAISFARSVHEVGGQNCLTEQIAGHLRVSPTGGAFRTRMAHSRIFGLVEFEKGTVRLTPLGMRIVDATQEASARVDAFLTVPLYKAIFEKYKGYTLPPPAALEREMGALGVSSKQTDRARQVFDRSAKEAGFYWAGMDRLTLPVLKSKPETRPIDETPPTASPAFGGGSGGGGYHPFVEGLLKTLPPVGQQWPVRDRAKWLKLAANAFDLIYEGDGEIEIKAAVPPKDDTAG